MLDGDELTGIDYLPGGMPPSAMLDISLRDLRALAEARPEREHSDTALEVALIGLVAYFEAFCKNQFAAIVNAFPELLDNFTANRRDVSVAIKDLTAIEGPITSRLGFLLAEKCDFGSTKSINGLFHDLLGVTPISRDEAKKLGRLLNDRNLLVHHGGIYTSRYEDSEYEKRDAGHGAFLDSLVIDKKDLSSWLGFVEELSRKLCDVTQGAVESFAESAGLSLDEERRKAIVFLAYCEI